MTTDEQPRIKITYATLRADNEDLHRGFEDAVGRVRASLGGHYRNHIDGSWRDGDGTFEVRSPIDRDLLLGSSQGHERAMSTTPSRPPEPLSRPGPRPRGANGSRMIRRAAELHQRPAHGRRPSIMSFEVGKNRINCSARSRSRRTSCATTANTMEENGGYDVEMGNLGDWAVHTRSILRPHGVFAVVSPFNFPMALSAGPTSAALIAGNTVVLKPSTPRAVVGGEAPWRRISTPASRRARSIS